MAGGCMMLVMLAVVLCGAFTPTGRYLARAGWEEARILARRRAIPAVIADPATSVGDRAKLKLGLAARGFAAESLGLRAKKSFTTYSRLERDTLVLVLSGAYRDQLRAYTWWFPIVGDVPYKGFFDFAAAGRAAEKMRGEGFDAFVRPSPAFSTLGFFNDPVLSTTLSADSLYLANTVIHELTHNTYYASGEADFNESFANWAGARGSVAFFRSRGDTAAAREAEARWADDTVLGGFFTSVYAAIDSAFRAHPGAGARAVRIAARDTIFARARSRLTEEIAPRIKTFSVAYLSRFRLDNAALLAYRTYYTDLPDFDVVYERCGGDVRAAIAQVIAIARASGRDPFGGLRGWRYSNGSCGRVRSM
jgi:predicted aminopeptidase